LWWWCAVFFVVVVLLELLGALVVVVVVVLELEVWPKHRAALTNRPSTNVVIRFISDTCLF
jgi:uncharacterized membrane protein